MERCRFTQRWILGRRQTLSEVIKDDALDFLKQANDKEAPFFMYLAFNAPHDPRQSPQSFLDRYPLENTTTRKLASGIPLQRCHRKP